MTTVNHFTDFYNAEKHGHKYHAVIAIGTNPVDRKHLRPDVKYLYLEFDDVTFSDFDIRIKEGHVAPNATLNTKIVDFIKELAPTDKLLVHCFAGYSRSPATVIIARCIRDGIPLHQAKDEIMGCRIPDQGKVVPNDIMLHNYLLTK